MSASIMPQHILKARKNSQQIGTYHTSKQIRDSLKML